MAAEKLEVKDFAAVELKIEEIAAEKRAKFAAEEPKNEEFAAVELMKKAAERVFWYGVVKINKVFPFGLT